MIEKILEYEEVCSIIARLCENDRQMLIDIIREKIGNDARELIVEDLRSCVNILAVLEQIHDGFIRLMLRDTGKLPK